MQSGAASHHPRHVQCIAIYTLQIQLYENLGSSATTSAFDYRHYLMCMRYYHHSRSSFNPMSVVVCGHTRREVSLGTCSLISMQSTMSKPS